LRCWQDGRVAGCRAGLDRGLRVRLAADRQSGSSYVLLFVLVLFVGMMVIAGLAVDGSGVVRAKQNALEVADEASRAGAQELSGTQGMGGQQRLDATRAEQTVRDWVAVAAPDLVVDDVQVEGSKVTVHLSGRYKTVFLGIILIDEIGYTMSGSADGFQVLDGQAVP